MSSNPFRDRLERMKKLAENCLDDAPKAYAWEAEYIYVKISSLLQIMDLDEEDKRKEQDG